MDWGSPFIFVQPRAVLLDRLTAIIRPSFRAIWRLHLRMQNLRRARDLLLPRLLSGQIALGEAAEQTQDQTQAVAEQSR